MTSEQYPGFPPNGVPNGVPPQASGPALSAFSNQPAAPQNQPVTPNGPVYQTPGYVVANGQLAAAPVTKSRRGLVIGILAVSLVLVLAVVLFILLFTGVLSLPGGSKAADGSASASPDDVISGLTQSEKEPELIDMGNDLGKFYAFIGDTLLATDGDEVWAFSLKSQQEIWRSSEVIEELNCDPAYGPWFVDRAESNPNLVLIDCPSETTGHYAVISAKDGKVVTKKELNSNEVNSFMEILKDDSLVTCENNELTRYDSAIGAENKLWSQPVEACGYGVREYDSGWLRMTWESDDWGPLFNLQDGSQPPFAQTFIDSIGDLEEDSYSFTPLAKGNFAVEYFTKTGGDSPMGHAVIVDAQGNLLSQTYDNAFFSFADDERVVLVVSHEFANYDELEESTRLDPATGQELWTNEDAEFGCALGADKQFIWGWDFPCGSDGAPENHSGLVLDTNTGKTLPMGGLRDAQDIYRTDSGFIVETHNDEEENGGIKLKSFAWKDGAFVKMWSQKFKDIPYLVEHQHRLYATSSGDDFGIVGYLGYESAN